MLKAIHKNIALLTATAFLLTTVMPAGVYAQIASTPNMPWMPQPGVRISLSPEFEPSRLVGITVHPDNALQFDFLIHKGDKDFGNNQKEYQTLVKYFLASLTVPDDEQWVNLSPYEKDRIIPDDFGKTEMGRDLLAQDYILKQITASLIYPEANLGKKFWDKVYQRAQQEYGSTQIPVNTFNKVWIVPDEAVVYESGNTAYILKSHLKVMMEEDYLSLDKHNGISSMKDSNKAHRLAAQVVKEIILPQLEIEVNEGKNFALLRQIYSGMILATWYKKALRESFLGKIYADKDKVKGVDQNPKANEIIYQRYLRAFKKGVFNYIKEDVDTYSQQVVPRKYFSGGFEKMALNRAMSVWTSDTETAQQRQETISTLQGDLGSGVVRAVVDLNLFRNNAMNVQQLKTALVAELDRRPLEQNPNSIGRYVREMAQENSADFERTLGVGELSLRWPSQERLMEMALARLVAGSEFSSNASAMALRVLVERLGHYTLPLGNVTDEDRIYPDVARIMKENPEVSVPRIMSLIEEPNLPILYRKVLIDILGEMGPSAGAAVGLLKELGVRNLIVDKVSNYSDYVRNIVLAKIGTKEAIEALLEQYRAVLPGLPKADLTKATVGPDGKTNFQEIINLISLKGNILDTMENANPQAVQTSGLVPELAEDVDHILMDYLPDRTFDPKVHRALGGLAYNAINLMGKSADKQASGKTIDPNSAVGILMRWAQYQGASNKPGEPAVQSADIHLLIEFAIAQLFHYSFVTGDLRPLNQSLSDLRLQKEFYDFLERSKEKKVLPDKTVSIILLTYAERFANPYLEQLGKNEGKRPTPVDIDTPALWSLRNLKKHGKGNDWSNFRQSLDVPQAQGLAKVEAAIASGRLESLQDDFAGVKSAAMMAKELNEYAKEFLIELLTTGETFSATLPKSPEYFYPSGASGRQIDAVEQNRRNYLRSQVPDKINIWLGKTHPQFKNTDASTDIVHLLSPRVLSFDEETGKYGFDLELRTEPFAVDQDFVVDDKGAHWRPEAMDLAWSVLRQMASETRQNIERRSIEVQIPADITTTISGTPKWSTNGIYKWLQDQINKKYFPITVSGGPNFGAAIASQMNLQPEQESGFYRLSIKKQTPVSFEAVSMAMASENDAINPILPVSPVNPNPSRLPQDQEQKQKPEGEKFEMPVTEQPVASAPTDDEQRMDDLRAQLEKLSRDREGMMALHGRSNSGVQKTIESSLALADQQRQRLQAELSELEKKNKAMNGGIDLNAANLNLQIKRDGRGVPLPLVQQDMAQLNNIEGFVPVIIKITPITNLPLLSQLQQKLQSLPAISGT